MLFEAVSNLSGFVFQDPTITVLFGLKHHQRVITCQFLGSGVISQVSFSIRESYSLCIIFFHSSQSEQQITCLRVPGSSCPLRSMFDSNILSVCTKCACDLAARVLVNLAELEDASKLSRLELGCEVSFSGFLDIFAEPQKICPGNKIPEARVRSGRRGSFIMKGAIFKCSLGGSNNLLFRLSNVVRLCWMIFELLSARSGCTE